MKLSFCFLFLLILPNILLGQSPAATKRRFLAAVRHAEIEVMTGKKNHQHKWYADSAVFATADTIAFYNSHNSPIQNSSCSKAIWGFYDTQYLSSEIEQTCREPSTGTTHPDGSTFFIVSFIKRDNHLLLKLANKYHEEYYTILSVQELNREKKRFDNSKISLVRLKK